ncbi:conserved hypothetical protein [Ricinus communis]|uniref:Uncharacterized protein n=1 Tax=Ricinus communis TaxID=3988 RepID=B9S427_RICCO|nr:conserved hypothetical protein [Ricinus communis]
MTVSSPLCSASVTVEDKTPRPNGFSSSFFQKSWLVVGSDMFPEVEEFFENGKLLSLINAITAFTIIPKTASLESPCCKCDF